jgi:hypothetical protein
MGKSYGTKPVHLKKAKLTRPLFLAIGKLVRAMAEIEDMVDLHICNLAELSESKAFILLGRTAVTRRIEIAEALAILRTDDAHKVHKRMFDERYSDLVDCRNAVAHGTLIGKGEGRLYFLSSNPGGKPNDGRAPRQVSSYTPHQIIKNAELAQELVPHYERHLQVEVLRAERLQRPLTPHPKGLGQAGAKPQRPPLPSAG